MSKRVPVVRRKAAKQVPHRTAPTSKKAKRAKVAHSPAKKTTETRTQRAGSKKSSSKKVATKHSKSIGSAAPARKKKANVKTLPAAKRVAKTAAKARSMAGSSVAKRPLNVKAKARPETRTSIPPKTTVKPVPPKLTRPKAVTAPISRVEPVTPRSVAPPIAIEPKPVPKVRSRNAQKVAARGAYVSPAQRVLEAQQAVQGRMRRAQIQREEAERKTEPSAASEPQSNAESDTTSSEMRPSTAFVRRGRLSPRDPNSSPLSEPGAATVIAPGSFDLEWRKIERVARQISVSLKRDLVQGWLEPWLNGKDTLALIQSALDSGTPYFVATQAMERKTLLIERSQNEAIEIAQRFTRLGLNVWSLTSSEVERKETLGHFAAAQAGTLVVPLSLFDDDDVMAELQQLKLTGLVAEEAQRISELSFDFDIAYDRIPNVVNRLGRLPTLAILRSAPPSVRTDLPHRLGLRNAQRVDLQPLPDTIALEVPVVDVPHRGGTLLERLSQASPPVMVLCSAPEEVDEVVEVLGRASANFRGSAALAAVGMGHIAPSTRSTGPAVTVGISGMPSSRDPLPKTIIHYRAPTSLEQYARDLGRLDATQADASAIVLASTEDEANLRQWLERQRPRPEELIQVATLVSQHAGPGKMALVDTLIASSGIGRTRLESLLSILGSAGWVEHKVDWVRIPEHCTDLPDRARALAARLKSLRERDHQRMRSVSAYVIGRNCRHESMRRHFGTAAQRPCGVCDNCRTKATHAAANGGAPPSEPISRPVSQPEVIFE